MSNLLLVTSSLFGEQSQSRGLADEFVATWQGQHPGTRIVARELTPANMRYYDADTITALMTAAAERSAEQQALVAFVDALIAEIEAADTIVLAVPMYNFAIPSTLKSWIDHIAQAGRTFRYSAAGPEGLLKGKTVFVLTARGGVYSEGPAQGFDFQAPYLRAVLGFLGITDVTFLHLEGLKINPEAAAAGLVRARADIANVIAARSSRPAERAA